MRISSPLDSNPQMHGSKSFELAFLLKAFSVIATPTATTVASPADELIAVVYVFSCACGEAHADDLPAKIMGLLREAANKSHEHADAIAHQRGWPNKWQGFASVGTCYAYCCWCGAEPVQSMHRCVEALLLRQRVVTLHCADGAPCAMQASPTAPARICRVYRSTAQVQDALTSTHVSATSSILHVAQPLALDSVAVLLTLSLHNTSLSNVQIWLSAGTFPSPSAALSSHNMTVLLKPLAVGGSATDLVNVTFLDSAPTSITSIGSSSGWPKDANQAQAPQPNASFRPAQPLATFVFGTSQASAVVSALLSQNESKAAAGHPFAGGPQGSVGGWWITVTSSMTPNSSWSVSIPRWHLTLCGTKVPPLNATAQAVGNSSAGAHAANATATASQQQQSGQQARSKSWRRLVAIGGIPLLATQMCMSEQLSLAGVVLHVHVHVPVTVSLYDCSVLCT